MIEFDAIVALGSNLGDKRSNIAAAVDTFTQGGDIEVLARSSNYRTEPWGHSDQDWFLNACLAVATPLDPHALLHRCQEVERQMGRARSIRWGPRIIDMDILVHRAGAVATPDLVIPHPLMSERAFVLVPLAEIAPDLVVSGRKVRELLAAIDTSGVTRISENPARSRK